MLFFVKLKTEVRKRPKRPSNHQFSLQFNPFLREPEGNMSALKLTLQSFFSVPKFLQLRKILVQHENFGHAHHWRVHVGATGPGHGTAGHKDKLFYVFSLILHWFHEKFLLPPLWFFLFFNFRWTSLAVNLSCCWELSKARTLVVISRICWEEGPPHWLRMGHVTKRSMVNSVVGGGNR